MAFNPLLFTKILGAVKSVVPTVKTWLFADGKFRADRALFLLFFFAALAVSVHFLGVDQTADVVDMLDDVGEVIGLITDTD